MTVRAWLARHLAAACVLGAASIASAQITTGTITGTVRDGQGGVIPGATVILTSDTQGTKSSPVITNATGDFVFVNLRADTYNIEITMPSFNTLKRSGLQVSPGERVSAAPSCSRSAATEVVDVQPKPPRAVQLRRALLHDRDRRGHQPADRRRSFTRSRRWRQASPHHPLGIAPRPAAPQHIQMDGCLHDTGSNRAIIDLNVESIAEVKVLVSSYMRSTAAPAGCRSRGHQDGTNRFRGRSTRGAELRLNANSKTNILTTIPRTSAAARMGYSIGGPVGKPGGQQQAVLLLHAGVRARTGGNDRTAIDCRRSSSGRAIFEID